MYILTRKTMIVSMYTPHPPTHTPTHPPTHPHTHTHTHTQTHTILTNPSVVKTNKMNKSDQKYNHVNEGHI